MPGLRSGSSGSATARPVFVVSTPFGRPMRAPAAGTVSIGRGPRRGLGPDRMRLFDVSSLVMRSAALRDGRGAGHGNARGNVRQGHRWCADGALLWCTQIESAAVPTLRR